MKSSLRLTTQFFCFFLLFLHVFCYTSPSLNSSFAKSSLILCQFEQRHALLQFKSSFSIKTFSSKSDPISGFALPYPKIESWKEGTDCCSWDGVTCDLQTGYVIGLDLSNGMLYGTFHSHNALFSLSHLRSLDLSNNDFNNSKISPQFGLLSKLTNLNLSRSAFKGKVPLQISRLSNLVSLDLSWNADLLLDSSSFSKIVRNLTKLVELNLNEIDMSMVASSSFMNLSSSLSSLELQFCQLSGETHENFNFPSGLVSLDLFGNSNLRLDTGAFVKLVQNLTKLNKFDLSFVNMSLVAPSSLMNLSSSLSTLKLSYCDLQGKFPSDLLQRPRLRLLYLSYNYDLTSFLPMSYWSSSLEYLDVSWTKFRIYLEPDLVSNLSSLKQLALRGCKFIGSSLALFSNLTQLTLLDLSMVSFDTEIPPSFGDLQQLTSLDTSFNNFGELLHSLGNLKHLESLDLSSNNLSGEIPSSFTNLKKLTKLNLKNNSFSGPLPTFFSNFSQLISFDLSKNLLIGSIPSEIGTLSTLRFLDLSNNFFNQTIPSSIFTLPLLECLSLQNNQLHGPIPDSIFSLVELQVLVLSSNLNLTGGLSSSVCNLQYLTILDLSNNSLTGFIPQCLGNFSNTLSVLHLGMNNFHGIIPEIFLEGSRLRYLNLNGNQLKGKISPSLINCTKLEVLDLGNNEIDDAFPIFLGSLPNLQILVLRSNKLHGSLKVPSHNFSFHKLRIFDLSNNIFDGPLPANYFNEFQAMMKNFSQDKLYMPGYITVMRGSTVFGYGYVVNLTFKSLEIQITRIQTALTTIDLSLNKFTGEIPNSIGKLKSLRLLNLSHNCLSGHIQSSLTNLNGLESLDLSSNLLTGRIPMQLTDLTFLQIFHVSYNQLEGPIPRGKQFNTFENDSYVGNTGLCGFPLSKACEDDDDRQDVEQSNLQEKDDSWFKNEFELYVVMIGYACGLVIGFSIGYIVFTLRKPRWLVNKVEVAGHWIGGQKKFKKKSSWT